MLAYFCVLCTVWVYTCMPGYSCIHAYMGIRVYMHAWVFVYTCIHGYSCIHACMGIRVYMHAWVFVYTCMHAYSLHVHAHVCDLLHKPSLLPGLMFTLESGHVSHGK